MFHLREWLIRLRGKRSQAEVAAECGVSQQFYSAIELGERRPSVEVAKKIAAVLGFNWTRFASTKF
ncbi:MAG TPA: helix-turn-helix transcriptional regulator [Clostridiales bacterium]|nr:helix-turn-helix transcriptional regulator [Clostridiales bacterium]HPV01895.1 helix-turn-helix transcriptional regulator [Clostridiales bacterium]